MASLSSRISTETRYILLMSFVLWAVTIAVITVSTLGKVNMVWRAPLEIVTMVVLWLIARSLKDWPFYILLIIGPFIALFIQLSQYELVWQLEDGIFSWQYEEYNFARYMISNYALSMFYYAWFLGYFAIKNHFKFIKESLSAAEARTQATGAQLAMLRYQINPHFLFNTLNSVSALVLNKDNDKAENMIGGLSRFLRFSLDKDPSVKITLEEEVQVAREYLAIEQIRFSDRLVTSFEIDDDTLACLVPSLILQPAIENAIKHAISQMTSTGEIHITSHLDGGNLHLSICDNGPGLPKSKAQGGVGIKNMQDRVSVMYPGTGRVRLENRNPSGVCVHITLPCEKGL